MKRAANGIARSLALAGILGLSSLALGTAPASAGEDTLIVVAFHGTATIDCFGCGAGTGTADISGYDPSVGGILATPDEGVDANEETAHAVYTVQEPTGAACVISGTAEGTATGTLANVAFNWTRVGAVAVVSVSGEFDGSGVAAFAVTSPVGSPCGAHGVVADVAGVIVATD